MSESNPYAPPAAVVVDPVQEGLALADRGTRLGAAILDSLILIVPTGLVAWGFYASLGLRFWVAVPGLRGISLGLVMAVLGTGIDLAINGYLLVHCGQTVGKRICSIRIAKPDGSVPSLVDSYLKRKFIFTLAGRIPYVGALLGLADALMIFRKSCRCLHDDLAGTVVLNA